ARRLVRQGRGGRSRCHDGRRGAPARRAARHARSPRRGRRTAGPSPRLPEFPQETLNSPNHTTLRRKKSMSVSIRLQRGGAKKRPYYKIVVANSRSPRDGAFIEKIGTYNPLLAKDDEKRVVLNAERA